MIRDEAQQFDRAGVSVCDRFLGLSHELVLVNHIDGSSYGHQRMLH